ncbi:MAG: GerMN domain-containing protein [Trueperaceae bacterium]|nr:GerMN domain-containing protein [Trueperaceae bacterium]
MARVVLRLSTVALLLLLLVVAFLSVRTARRLPNVIIYLVKDNETSFSLEPVGRKVNAGTPEEKLRGIVQALQDGPSSSEKAKGLMTTLPGAMTVNRLELVGSEVRIDLSTEFEQGGGNALMVGRLNQLFYSLTQAKEVSEISLFIDGLRVTAFSQQGIMIASPWSRQSETLPVW